MTVRRVVAWVILGAFLAIAVFAVLGNPLLATVFLIVEASVLGHHALRLCARCSNTACAFNPRSPAEPSAEAGTEAYSDLPITRTTVVPLLASYPLAVIAAWQFSPIATVAVGAVGLGAHQVFRRVTCSHCGNDCVGNCNRTYRRWKATRPTTER